MTHYRVLITTIFLHPDCAVDRRLRAEGFETIFKPLLAPWSEDQLKGFGGTLNPDVLVR
jgi:hypothetical protein